VHSIEIQFDPLYTEYTYFPLSLSHAVQQIGGFVSALKLLGVLLGLYHFYGFRRTLTKQHRLNIQPAHTSSSLTTEMDQTQPMLHL
jgi:hypothetical protein